MEAIESIEYRGYTIDIFQDQNLGESPRDWDNMGTMTCFHPNYELGDKHEFSDPLELKEILDRPDVIALPLYLYDHSGISISVSHVYPYDDKWDSMTVGYIWVDKAKIRECFQVKNVTQSIRQKVIDSLVCEINTYNHFITGNVYGYTIHNRSGLCVDSCWGYFGDYNDYMTPECKKQVEWFITEEIREHCVKLKRDILARVPMDYRTPLTVH